MSDTVDRPDESPNYLGQPTRKTGIPRRNKIGLALAGGVVSVMAVGFVYNLIDRSYASNNPGGSGQPEEIKLSGTAIPPVKKPDGPDVNYPVIPAPVYVSEAGPVAAPVQESEAAKRAREKKIEEYEAALRADISVPIFNGMDMQQQQSVQPVAHNAVPPRMAQPGIVPYGVPNIGEIDPGQNRQDEKIAFYNSVKNGSPYLNQTLMAPLSDKEIKAGSVIPCRVITGINSDSPGQVSGQVREDVYDSATGRYLLIPAGTKMTGEHDSRIAPGQDRVLVAWRRLVFSDGSSIFLNGMPGADQEGYSGFRERVNKHYWETFGNALMLSVLSAGIQLSQPRGSVNGTFSASQIASAALGQQMGQLGMSSVRQGLGRQNTVEISPGFNCNISVTEDIILPEWKGHQGTRRTAVEE